MAVASTRLTRTTTPPRLVQWLRKNYTSEAQLRAAWGTELGVDERLDAAAKPPQSLRVQTFGTATS